MMEVVILMFDTASIEQAQSIILRRCQMHLQSRRLSSGTLGCVICLYTDSYKLKLVFEEWEGGGMDFI